MSNAATSSKRLKAAIFERIAYPFTAHECQLALIDFTLTPDDFTRQWETLWAGEVYRLFSSHKPLTCRAFRKTRFLSHFKIPGRADPLSRNCQHHAVESPLRRLLG